jgi:hypothetical protein
MGRETGSGEPSSTMKILEMGNVCFMQAEIVAARASERSP